MHVIDEIKMTYRRNRGISVEVSTEAVGGCIAASVAQDGPEELFDDIPLRHGHPNLDWRTLK